MIAISKVNNTFKVLIILNILFPKIYFSFFLKYDK